VPIKQFSNLFITMVCFFAFTVCYHKVIPRASSSGLLALGHVFRAVTKCADRSALICVIGTGPTILVRERSDSDRHPVLNSSRLRKQLIYKDIYKHGQAKDSWVFLHAVMIKMQTLLRSGNQYLHLHGALAGAKKHLDAQIPFDHCVEQLHLPALAVQVGDHLWSETEGARQKRQAPSGVVPDYLPAHRCGEAPARRIGEPFVSVDVCYMGQIQGGSDQRDV